MWSDGEKRSIGAAFDHGANHGGIDGGVIAAANRAVAIAAASGGTMTTNAILGLSPVVQDHIRAQGARIAILEELLLKVEAELPIIADHKSNPGSTIGALAQLYALLCEARRKRK